MLVHSGPCHTTGRMVLALAATPELARYHLVNPAAGIRLAVTSQPELERDCSK